MATPKIYDASDVKAETRVSPAQRIIESLDGDFKTMRQVAEEVGVHVETLRRLCRTPRVKAPSKATKSGKLVIYLFTPEDVEEVREYFDNRERLVNDQIRTHKQTKDIR